MKDKIAEKSIESRHALEKKIDKTILQDLDGKTYQDVFQGYEWMRTYEQLKKTCTGVDEEDLWNFMWERIHRLNKEGKLRLDPTVFQVR
jgi:hypothetical protein